MKKTMLNIVLFVVFLFSVSAHTGKVIDAEKGYTAPFFTLEQNGTTVSLAEMKGKYVLLTFWASSDALSRIACQEYTEFARNVDEGKPFCHMSINFDRSERLFNELVRIDGFDAKTQFYAQGEIANRLKKDYHLENGYQSFLVNPQGQVMEVNPSTTRLTQILSN